MTHSKTPSFRKAYDALDANLQELADKSFQLLEKDLRHPGLHFKKAGKFWSARVGLTHRALAIEQEAGMLWVWIGSHNEYARLLR